MWGNTQNFGPIGSAVSTFVGYKSDRQTDKQSISNSLKYQRFTPSGNKDIGSWKFNLLAKTQFLWGLMFDLSTQVIPAGYDRCKHLLWIMPITSKNLNLTTSALQC